MPAESDIGGPGLEVTVEMPCPCYRQECAGAIVLRNAAGNSTWQPHH